MGARPSRGPGPWLVPPRPALTPVPATDADPVAWPPSRPRPGVSHHRVMPRYPGPRRRPLRHRASGVLPPREGARWPASPPPSGRGRSPHRHCCAPSCRRTTYSPSRFGASLGPVCPPGFSSSTGPPRSANPPGCPG